MPKNIQRLTEKDIKDLKYASLTDFSRKMDEYQDINDKLKLASEYIILHSFENNPDCTRDEIIEIARMKIADASYQLKQEASKLFEESNKAEEIEEEKMDDIDEDEIQIFNADEGALNATPYAVNPFASEKDDLDLELFMAYPSDYLRNYAFKKYNKIEEENIELHKETIVKEKYLSYYNNAINKENKLEKGERNRLHIITRLQSKFGSKAALDKIFSDTKAGFFSRVFTQSNAAKNLDTVYQAFNNKDNAYYGDMDALQKAATEYLVHKFPNWKPGEPYPNETAINKLSSVEISRTILSIGILDTINKEKNNQTVLDTIVQGCAKDEDVRNQLDQQMAVNQELFQKKLFEDLKEDIESGLIQADFDNNIKVEKNQNIDQKAQSVEESVLDKTMND